MIIKTDNRKSNATVFLGLILCGLTYFSLKSDSKFISVNWSIGQNIFGIVFIGIGFLKREIIQLTEDSIIIKNRLNVFSKIIPFNEIRKVRTTDTEYPIPAYNNSLLHLILWDKKFNRFRNIELFNLVNKRIFTIDGQAIASKDFFELANFLKRKGKR